MKKNKLYTANKWNQSAFMPQEKNLFSGLFGSSQMNFGSQASLPPLESYLPKGLSNDTYRRLAIGSAGQMQNAFQNYSKSVVNNFGKGPLVQNTSMLSQKDPSKFFGSAPSKGDGSGASVGGGGNTMALTGAAVGALGAVNTGERRGMWDTLDPVHHIAGGRESAVGNAMGDTGVALTQAGLSSGQPWLALAGAGLKVVGGLTNAAFGIKEDKAKIEAANNSINQNKNYVFSGSLDDMPEIAAATNTDAYEGGWFSRGKAREKNEKLKKEMIDARQWAFRSRDNGINNILSDQMNNALRNYAAFGGPIDSDDMGVINYDFMDRYLTAKEEQNKKKGTAALPVFMNRFAFGGDMQAHGSDFSSGLTHINAGGSHEENPNEGVQMGVDNEGTPNLVEEGETVYNDYVFSNRILADEATKQMFHLPKKKDITFADISKKLEKEISERPNDPISEAGFKAQMQTLEEQQERQKSEMEAERARAAFEALSPEEQTAVMQNAAQQEQMAQQAAQEQAIAEQHTMQQPSPEEVAMMQQQMQVSPEEQLAMEQQQLAQMQANVSALGGELVRAGDVNPQANKFAGGGWKARRIAKKYGADWFKQMGNALGMTEDEMKGFLENLNPNDPDANMAAFNAIYGTNQENAARKRYIDSQRQSKKNELFGDKGLYRTSDDGKNFYKAMINSKLRNGWINANYRGQEEYEDDIKDGRFISDAAYQKLSKEEQEKYRRINEKVGDKMYDFNGRLLETALPDGTTVDSILDAENSDYAKGFKWDPKEAQTLQYPIDMELSNTSYLRYVPALGGAVGLMNDLFSSPDYSRAEGVQRAGQITPMMVKSNFNPTYMTYRPLDIWYAQNRANALSRATDRNIMNTSGGNRGTAMAGLIANGYNSQLASGNLFRQAQEYNDALDKQVITHNSGENKTFAQLDLQSQLANQRAAMEAGMYNARYKTLGYQMMDDIDARRNASMNANLTNVLQSIGNIGEEAYDTDRLRWLERTGVLKSKTLGANGGKLLKKKKGLTY